MSTSTADNQEGVKFIDARSASKLVNYSPDYITRLAREGKIQAVQAGRQWLVDADSLKLFTLEVQAQKRARAAKIREERKVELLEASILTETPAMKVLDVSLQRVALAKTVALAACVFLFVHIVWFSLEEDMDLKFLATGVGAIQEHLSAAVLSPVSDLVQAASLSFVADQENSVGETEENSQHSTNAVDSSSAEFQGIVVISETDESAEKIKQIRESFSDDVEISLDGDDTGVVTPVFENRSGDSYRFLLTPVTPTSN